MSAKTYIILMFVIVLGLISTQLYIQKQVKLPEGEIALTKQERKELLSVLTSTAPPRSRLIAAIKLGNLIDRANHALEILPVFSKVIQTETDEDIYARSVQASGKICNKMNEETISLCREILSETIQREKRAKTSERFSKTEITEGITNIFKLLAHYRQFDTVDEF